LRGIFEKQKTSISLAAKTNLQTFWQNNVEEYIPKIIQSIYNAAWEQNSLLHRMMISSPPCRASGRSVAGRLQNRYFIPPQIKPQTYNCEVLTVPEICVIKYE
jgi:hypothetical protein